MPVDSKIILTEIFDAVNAWNIDDLIRIPGFGFGYITVRVGLDDIV